MGLLPAAWATPVAEDGGLAPGLPRLDASPQTTAVLVTSQTTARGVPGAPRGPVLALRGRSGPQDLPADRPGLPGRLVGAPVDLP